MRILDLFNEYNLSPEMTGGEVEQPRTEKDRNTMSRIYKEYIVSRDFGWIKRLVDNDKIDYTQLEGYSLWETVKNDGWTNYICLLMILAASDSPIESLTLYLK